MNQQTFKILIISDFDDRDANVVRDFLFCFNRHSRHDCYYIFDPRSINLSFTFTPFDVILLFWNIYLPGSRLSNMAREKIRRSQALKLLFLQDEYRDVRAFNQLMDELGVQIMFTCVSEKNHTIFYPPSLIPSLQATYTVLTGYAPAYLEQSSPPEKREYPIDIGYRSRSVPYYLGDLGREKSIIAENFLKLASQYGFICDISVSEEDRIYGRQWVEFLKASRYTLGSPSGASVVDFTGEIRRNCEDYQLLHPEATYEEVKRRFFADVDGKVMIDTVSPRIFESAALGSVMVMHDGYYGGILDPDRHFISVRKDYSNIDEVISRMKDEAFTRQIATTAYKDLIASGEYSYQTFVRRFDSILDAHISSTSSAQITKMKFYGAAYAKFGQWILPMDDQFIPLPGGKLFEFFDRVKTAGQNFSSVSLYPALWRLLFFYLLGTHWKNIPVKSLVMDLARLGIIYSISKGRSKITASFQVGVRYHPESARLSFASHAHPAGSKSTVEDLNRTFGDVDFDLSQFVNSLQRKCALLDWDHSSVGMHLEYRRNERTYTLDMGENGVYRFQALAGMAEYCSDVITKLLGSVITEIDHG
jgi:hypothetical protein